jgi:hemolysin activation/secretion protein
MLHNTSPGQAPARAARAEFAATRALVIISLIAALPANVVAAEPARLRSAVIDGSTVYSPAEFFATYRGQLGHPIARESAQAIVGAIADLYRDGGYARPEMRFDQAQTANGILRINVIEPYIARVTIEGAPGPYRDELEQIAGRLYESRPLQRDAIPQALAAMRQLPGLTVSAATRRDDTAAGANELVLQAEFSAVAGNVNINNRGTDQVGPTFVLGQLAANNVFGWHEKLGLVYSAATSTREYLGGGLFLDMPLGDDGARGMAMIFRSDSAPNEAPLNLSDEYRRERATLRFTRPLKQTADRSLTFSGAFDAEDLTVDRDGVDVRNDKLRVLEAGVRMAWRAGNATQYSSTLEFRKGLDILGGGLQADDLPVDPRQSDFLILQLQVSSSTRLNELWSLRFDTFAQQSAQVLPDSERFKIGGERLGRGFEVAEIAGDQGLGGKALIRRELTAAGSALGRTSAYGYYDYGSAWKQDEGGRESAATSGVGMSLQGVRFSGYVEVAKPLTHADVEGKRDTKVFGELSYRF